MATIADVVNKAKRNLSTGQGRDDQSSGESSSAINQSTQPITVPVVPAAQEVSALEEIAHKTGNKEPLRVEELEPELNDALPDEIEYTRTQVISVTNETLTANRVIAQNKEDPNSTPFHMLRAKVLQELRRNDWNTIAISAPTPGAGKSLVTVNLAMSIAMEVNQTVLIVDMDLRQPSLHQYFSIDPDYGVQDYIQNDIEIEKMLINPGVERLSLLPGRKRMLNSAEKLASPKVKALTEELKGRYKSRIVIYDLPPLLVSDDVMVFLPYVDCSLLVVESGKNTPEEIEASMKLAEVKPLLGTVLNKDVAHKKVYVY